MKNFCSIGKITLTGADERTDVQDLVRLAHDYPEVEIGLLYTATPEGRPRYPSRHWILHAATALSGRVAIHVCGRGARHELSEGGMADLIFHAPRIQVNGRIEAAEAEWLSSLVGTLITQHNESNTQLLDVRAPNHVLLMDASGGRGVSPEAWTPPDTPKLIGFAGGMGPDNLAVEYPRISQVARPGSWSDMEGKLRENDWFSLRLARQCADLHRKIVADTALAIA